MKKKTQAFTVVMAVFVLVILGLLSSYVVGIATFLRESTNYSVQNNNSFYAARSGLEWGIYRIVNDLDCPPTTVINMTQGSIKGFRVTMSCTQNTFTSGPLTFKVHNLIAFAEIGTFGTSNYISRTVRVTVLSGV